MSYLIETPNKNFSDVRHGVPFVDGKGKTNDKKVAQALKEDFGYKVTEIKSKDDGDAAVN